MHCIEVINANNAKAGGISLEENERLAKQGQFIIRNYARRDEGIRAPVLDSIPTTPNWFQFDVTLS